MDGLVFKHLIKKYLNGYIYRIVEQTKMLISKGESNILVLAIFSIVFLAACGESKNDAKGSLDNPEPTLK